MVIIFLHFDSILHSIKANLYIFMLKFTRAKCECQQAAARRLLLLQPTAAMATATNTFHVKGAAHQPSTTTTTAVARGAKPSVEFNASTKSAPGSRFNPRHNY
jgi:hypothetical protein